MTGTINRGYPYPRLRGDGADVAYWLQQLAENVDVDVQALLERLNSRTTAIQYDVPLAAGWASVGGPLLAARDGDLVVVTGRVVRTSGTSMVIATVPTLLRPHYQTFSSLTSENAGNNVGPTFQLSIATGGALAVNNREGSGSWNTQTWLPLNISYMANPAA